VSAKSAVDATRQKNCFGKTIRLGGIYTGGLKCPIPSSGSTTFLKKKGRRVGGKKVEMGTGGNRFSLGGELERGQLCPERKKAIDPNEWRALRCR